MHQGWGEWNRELVDFATYNGVTEIAVDILRHSRFRPNTYGSGRAARRVVTIPNCFDILIP